MIGIDLVFIPEFRKQLELGGNAFLERAFRMSEMKNHSDEHLAGLWAAKEAVIKASDDLPENMTDIQINHQPSGKPFAKFGLQNFAISIAHHGEYAVAVAYRVYS